MSSRGQLHMQNTLHSLQARGDQFTRLLINERQRVTQLQHKLNEVNKATESQREINKQKAIALLNKHHTSTAAKDAYIRADGVNPTRTAITNQRKMVKSMEGRLNKALVRRNSIETENNVIKERIGMLRSKICNDNVNRAYIEKELKSIQERMDEIMRRAAVASEQTDKLEQQRNLLLKENLEEEAAYHEECEKLSIYVTEQARLLRESIATVANDITKNSDSAHDGGGVGDADRQHRSAAAVIEDVDPVEDIRQLKEKMERLDAHYEASSRHQKNTDEKVRQYEQNLKVLQDVSGVESIDDILASFVKQEEESFSLFSYIQALNQEIDDITEENKRLEHELEADSRNQMRQENQRAAVVSKYKGILKEAEEERRKMNDIAREGRQTVQQIATKVQGLYWKLRCRQLEQQQMDSASGSTTSTTAASPSTSTPPISAAAPAPAPAPTERRSNSTTIDSATTNQRSELQIMDRKLTMCSGEQISEGNILRHMELIERRTCEIIAVYAKRLATSKKAQRRPSVILSPKMFQLQRTLAPPPESGESDAETQSDDDSSNEDEFGSRPMSINDMRLGLMSRPHSASTPIHRENIVSTRIESDTGRNNKPRVTII